MAAPRENADSSDRVGLGRLEENEWSYRVLIDGGCKAEPKFQRCVRTKEQQPSAQQLVQTLRAVQAGRQPLARFTRGAPRLPQVQRRQRQVQPARRSGQRPARGGTFGASRAQRTQSGCRWTATTSAPRPSAAASKASKGSRLRGQQHHAAAGRTVPPRLLRLLSCRQQCILSGKQSSARLGLAAAAGIAAAAAAAAARCCCSRLPQGSLLTARPQQTVPVDTRPCLRLSPQSPAAPCQRPPSCGGNARVG